MARRGKSRGALSRDDLAIWQKAVEKINPLVSRPGPQKCAVLTPTNNNKPTTREPIPQFHIGERAPFSSAATLPQTEPKARNLSAHIDKRNFERLRKGRLHIDARLDLHGLTLAQAHPALTAFIMSCRQNNKRLLLVITGKSAGRGGAAIMPERRGVLKQQVPHWLRLPPVAAVILEITEAARKHGGEGALYVYLKRQR